jgi:WXG100 family type VII secretion target
VADTVGGSDFGDTVKRGEGSVAETTRVTQAELDAAAKRFEEVNGELQGMLRTLLGQLERMKDDWQGAGGRSFDAVKVAWSNDLASLNTNLLETAAGIKSAGRNYNVSDAEASQKLNAINSGTTILPL